MSAADAGCLGCNRCEDGPMVTLHTGVQVCNYCPAFKDECLARHVLSMPTVQERRQFLAGWGQKHGEAEGRRMADLVRAVWEAKRRA